MTNQFRTRIDRAAQPISSGGRSHGSFYELLPNFLEAVQKPEKDDILKRLHESTKSDKKIEWRMRSRYEGACRSEFDGLKAHSSEGAVHTARDFTGQRRRKDYAKGDGRHRVETQSVTSNSPRSDLTLFPLHRADEDKTVIASAIRERCIRKGHLYGPEAIAALCGHGVSRSSPRRSSRVQSEDLPYDDYNYDGDSHSHCSKSSTYSWKYHMDDPKCESNVRSTSPVRQLGAIFGNKLYSLESWSESCSVASSAAKKSDASSETNSSVVATKQREDVLKSSRLFSKVGNAKGRNFYLSSVGKVKVEIGVPFLGGSGDRCDNDTKARKQGKMRMPKKFSQACSSVKRPMRRKQRGKVSKRKSVSKHRSLNRDKRLKGPKIEGINLFSSNSDAITEQGPKIRTVVLPYPQAKYRHTM